MSLGKELLRSDVGRGFGEAEGHQQLLQIFGTGTLILLVIAMVINSNVTFKERRVA